MGSSVHDEIWLRSRQRALYAQNHRAGGLEGGITNGEDLVVRGYLKPFPVCGVRWNRWISRVKNGEGRLRALGYCVLPAGGVVGEAMVALTLARSILEKFGGDSMEETLRNFNAYLEQVRRF